MCGWNKDKDGTWEKTDSDGKVVGRVYERSDGWWNASVDGMTVAGHCVGSLHGMSSVDLALEEREAKE
jgi:hypothetical protein